MRFYGEIIQRDRPRHHWCEHGGNLRVGGVGHARLAIHEIFQGSGANALIRNAAFGENSITKTAGGHVGDREAVKTYCHGLGPPHAPVGGGGGGEKRQRAFMSEFLFANNRAILCSDTRFTVLGETH